MPKKITSIDDASSVLLPQTVDALGVQEGGELEIEMVRRPLVVRSVQEAQHSREFGKIFESVMKRRGEAYEQLAEGLE